MATKRQIMLKCLRQLSMVYGSATNRYAEEKLYSMIDDALETVFKYRFWDRHIKKIKTKLNNGYPVLKDLNLVCRDFDDVQTILNNQSYPQELSRANSSVIKEAYTGSAAYYFQRADHSDKTFQVIPASSGGEVWVIFRTLCKPDVYDKFLNGENNIDPANNRFEFTAEDEIPFDELAIRYYVCWQYMVLKADNKDATNMYQQMYSVRISELEDDELNNTMSYTVGTQQTNANGWWTE